VNENTKIFEDKLHQQYEKLKNSQFETSQISFLTTAIDIEVDTNPCKNCRANFDQERNQYIKR